VLPADAQESQAELQGIGAQLKRQDVRRNPEVAPAVPMLSSPLPSARESEKVPFGNPLDKQVSMRETPTR